MTANKLSLFILLALVSCGKDVSISNKKLEYNSSLSNGNSISTDQEGLLVRGSQDRITVNGTSHLVSIYSSYMALEYIAAKPLNTQLQVKFRGKLKKDEMVLEIIEAK